MAQIQSTPFRNPSAVRMAEQNLVLSFTAQIFRVLCSYPISGKTVLLSGAARGHGLAIAQACVMATASHLILVGPNHTDLAEAKAFLESTMEDPIKQTVVHTYFSQDVDQDRIASIFFAVRSELGTPDVLILGNACPAPDKPIFEYNADDIDTCLDLNAKGKKAFIQNFLAPGTKKRKILINVSISAGAQNTIWRGRDWNAMQLLAHGNEEGGKWAFTVYDLLSDLISTQKIGGALIRRGQALDDMDLSGCIGLLLMSKDMAAVLNGRIVKEEPALGSARSGKALKHRAKLVTIPPKEKTS